MLKLSILHRFCIQVFYQIHLKILFESVSFLSLNGVHKKIFNMIFTTGAFQKSSATGEILYIALWICCFLTLKVKNLIWCPIDTKTYLQMCSCCDHIVNFPFVKYTLGFVISFALESQGTHWEKCNSYKWLSSVLQPQDIFMDPHIIIYCLGLSISQSKDA